MSTYRTTSNCSNHNYTNGDQIEVIGDDLAWFPTAILSSPSLTGTLQVEFDTLSVEKDGRRKRKEFEEFVDLDAGGTPVPAPESHRRFVIGEMVEVFHENAWRKAEVKDVFEDLKYKVVIGSSMAEVVVEDFRVRVYEEMKQDAGSNQEKPSHLVLQSRKGTKLRIVCKSKTSITANFQKGEPVEVRSQEEGYHGSWYRATVVSSIDKDDKLKVQYDTLTTDDEMQPLVETACASNVRPLPPIITRIDRFKLLEVVDAWYNDGWWTGLVCKVVPGLKYLVYFWTTNEELEFEHSKLRPHQELIDGKWVASFMRPKVNAKPRLEKVKLRMGERTLMVGLLRGLKVEISHGEKGVMSIWYPAVIIGPGYNGNYMVEYRTLITDNGREHVKEEVNVLCIRPCPPILQRNHQFQPNDRVDAWDINGWRIGRVCKVMKDAMYQVHFQATNNVAEFQHADLRPHQNFIDGTWLLTPSDIS